MSKALNEPNRGLFSAAANIDAPSQKPATSGKTELDDSAVVYGKPKDANER